MTTTETMTVPAVKEDRRSLGIPITVVRPSTDDSPETFFGYARDINRGGLGIGTIRPRSRGNRYLLRFSLPKPLARTVTCNCEVVWTETSWKGVQRDPGMGLRFLDVPAEITSAIDDWIRDESWPERL